MATTTNYGWTTPDDTSLVKDGASAIRTLGSSVDTTVKNLNPETTLGDISYRSSTANTKTRLGIGTSGQFLRVGGGGVPAWETVATGGMVSIATGSFSGASVFIDNIPGTYKNLQLVIKNYKPATDNTSLDLRFNNDSTANRYRRLDSNTTSYLANTFNATRVSISTGDDDTVATGLSVVTIFDYANTTTWKMANVTAIGVNATTTTQFNAVNGQIFYNQIGAITRLDILPASGNFTSGDYILYGVN